MKDVGLRTQDGLILKRRGAADVPNTLVGHVRVGPARMHVGEGFNLLGYPYPVS